MHLAQETPRLRGTQNHQLRCFIGSHHLFQWKPMTGPEMLLLGQHRPLSLLLNRKIRTSASFQMDTSWQRIFLSSSSRHASIFAFPEPSPSLTHSVPMLHLYSPRGSPRLWHFKSAFKWNSSLSWCVFSPSGETLSSLWTHKPPFSLKDKSQCSDACDVVCGIWQDGRHRETARLTRHWHFLSLVEFVSYYLCQLMKVCILSKTLPASVPLLIYKTQSNLRIKQND